MQLEDLGYNDRHEKFRIEHHLEALEPGRVIAEHKERYIVKTANGEFESEITGHLRFAAKSREDFPAVGDWVALATYDSGFAVIHHIFPRSSVIQRQAVGQFGAVQIVGTNIDYAFLVQAVDRDFNINRLERYLTLCYTAHVEPIIVLTKIDLISIRQLTKILENLGKRIPDVPVFTISNETQEGYDALKKIIQKGKTYCMLGSSGVGKSTLLNNLSGKTVMKTGAISSSTHKGKHVTSHRELILLDHGGILIDNPGMREVGIADSASGLETTFDKIISLAGQCKFKDCTHTSEIGCAVLEAVEQGAIDLKSYENYLKLEREQSYFESSVAERRKRDKSFGKMVRNIKKIKDSEQ